MYTFIRFKTVRIDTATIKVLNSFYEKFDLQSFNIYFDIIIQGIYKKFKNYGEIYVSDIKVDKIQDLCHIHHHIQGQYSVFGRKCHQM